MPDQESLDMMRTRVRASFDQQQFMTTLGAELEMIERGKCQIRLPFRKALTQQHGFIHAGVVSTLADTAAGYAAFSLMQPDSEVLTVEFKINLMAPATGEEIITKAEVLRKGKTLIICKADVFSIKDGKEIICAVLQSTLIELKKKK